MCNLDSVSLYVSFGESPTSQGCLLLCVASLAQAPERSGEGSGAVEVTLLSDMCSSEAANEPWKKHRKGGVLTRGLIRMLQTAFAFIPEVPVRVWTI